MPSSFKMDTSSPLKFITCDQLREEFAKCPDDIDKRILIIDVRNPSSYDRSRLCLDSRNQNKSSIRTKMRVMNIDPDLVQPCTAKTIASILDEEDLKRFALRHQATDVILIDSNTDNMSDLSDPKSKTMRLINALTKWDQPDKKIVVPVQILRGGYREWLAKYPHFTTNPNFDPDSRVNDMKTAPPPKVITTPAIISPQTNHILQPVVENGLIHPTIIRPSAPPDVPDTSPLQPSPSYTPQLPIEAHSPRTAINKPVPTPPIRQVPSAPKPAIVKNAPGTAVPVSPLLSLRPVLPRSHSSPNVAQADGDDLENNPSNQLDKLSISKGNTNPVNINNNHIIPSAPLSAKPRFDRNLKPSFNFEAINLIKAQLNFGRSPEASGKAITGLQNLGNTCFMNSVIQCLAYAPTLTSYFCSDTYYNHINFNSQYGSKGELAVEFGALVEKLNAHRHRYIEPKSFRDAITKHIGFAGNEQQDSHEFMMMLFDKLHHDLNIHAKDKNKQNGVNPQHANGNSNDDSNINIARATLAHRFWRQHLEMNKSVISDSFEGIFMSTLTCTYCKGQSNTFEVFNCLSLPIPSETRCHIKDCLNHFSNPERIEAAWECPRCKTKREADKKIVICKLPKILIIHLKRFSLDGRWRQKLQTTVDFPLNDLIVDCTTVLPQSAYEYMPSKSSYNLYAVVNHYGHLDGGHYTAFCRLENQKWYTFDDSNVTETKDSDVCGQSGYLLFYQIYGSVSQ